LLRKERSDEEEDVKEGDDGHGDVQVSSREEDDEGNAKGWEVVMPKVGKKTFPYTAKGKAAAQSESKKSGKKMTKAKGY
jgi:hypothetical protein